ncbi:LytR/AlgR family response regulator transcription factor [Balneola sp. MJW-20]|uniref:LytR/AlgR family response regulator transcription factor n=1 Tax=Gracilimonas aurantiaca TaxID=3234185 RepID=UPI0034678599
MAHQWNEILKRPVVGILDTLEDKFLLALVITVYTPLFMIIFQPFGVNNYDPSGSIDTELILGVTAVGVVQGLTVLITEIFITPYFIKPDSIGKLILHAIFVLILLSSTTFLIYNVMGGFHDWYLYSYFEFQWNIAFLGMIPFGAVILYLQYRNTREKADLLLDNKGAPDNLITLYASNGKDQFSVTLDKLLYMEARDNYVAISYRSENIVKLEMLRITLKAMEKQCVNYPIYRCHRSFLINLSQVVKVRGNRHKLDLYFRDSDIHVPVSRSYVNEIQMKMDIRHK